MVFNRRLILVLMLALVCALFSACAIEASLPTEPAAPTPAQEPEAVPTPAPTPEPDADTLCAMCRDGFFAAFAPDYSGHDDTSLGMLDMPGLIEKQPLYAELAADTHTLAQMCARTAAQDVKAMSSLIDQAAKNDNISTIFMVTDKQTFYGAMDLKDLIIARQDQPLEDLIVTSYPYVYGNELIDDCIEKLKDYSENSIPVLDNDNKLLGVITSQSIVELVDDEMGEDYAMFAGLTAEEDLKEPLRESLKKRLPWLLVLLGLGMVVSSVVGVFETVVSQLTIIMCFQSLILDMAGNVGTQSLAVTIRVLMDESLTGKQKAELVWKEMTIGFSNGLILGTLSFIVIGLYIALFKGKTFMFAYAVSGCIGIALVVAMVISGAVGTCIPLFFKKINVDPAVASGPLITTINDLVAVVTYYGLSWIFLIEMLHLAG